MLEKLSELPAQSLDLNSYRADFKDHFWANSGSWKLERQESFREPDVPSWQAMVRGDWETALKLIEEMRTPRLLLQRKLDEHNIVQHRIRIVSEPITPYLQWELHALNLWAELGERVRVMSSKALRDRETVRELPEVVVLGSDSAKHPVMYEIIYQDGELAGGRKFTDRALVDACRTEIIALLQGGEDIRPYFDREIAILPPPVPQEV